MTAEAFGEVTSVPETKERSVKVLELYLYAMGYNEIGHILRLDKGKEVTVDRSRRADIILDPKESMLSGVYCNMKGRTAKRTFGIWIPRAEHLSTESRSVLSTWWQSTQERRYTWAAMNTVWKNEE